MFKDQDGNPIVGFCRWCDKDFYTMDEVEAHNADEMAGCPMFQELKDKECGPPLCCNTCLSKRGFWIICQRRKTVIGMAEKRRING